MVYTSAGLLVTSCRRTEGGASNRRWPAVSVWPAHGGPNGRAGELPIREFGGGLGEQVEAAELVTNSVRHSNSRMAGGTVTVTLRVAADRVLVEVIDDGGATVPMLRRDGDLAESGRGLWLVDTYSLAGTITAAQPAPSPGSSACRNRCRSAAAVASAI